MVVSPRSVAGRTLLLPYIGKMAANEAWRKIAVLRSFADWTAWRAAAS